jgi:L-rhamnose mutarotase
MSTSASKEKILENNGFRYHFTRMIYFNKTTKKIFSFEKIDDHDEAWLELAIKEPNKSEWEFYTTKPLPAQTIKDILDELT